MSFSEILMWRFTNACILTVTVVYSYQFWSWPSDRNFSTTPWARLWSTASGESTPGSWRLQILHCTACSWRYWPVLPWRHTHLNPLWRPLQGTTILIYFHNCFLPYISHSS
jgi:hypothetical protein